MFQPLNPLSSYEIITDDIPVFFFVKMFFSTFLFRRHRLIHVLSSIFGYQQSSFGSAGGSHRFTAIGKRRPYYGRI